MEKREAYTRPYKIREVGPGSVEVTLPKQVVEKEARRHGLTVAEFVEKFRAVAYYDAFEGVYYRFEPATLADAIPDVIKEKEI